MFPENFKSFGPHLQKLGGGVSKNGQKRPKHCFGPVLHVDLSFQGFPRVGFPRVDQPLHFTSPEVNPEIFWGDCFKQEV